MNIQKNESYITSKPTDERVKANKSTKVEILYNF